MTWVFYPPACKLCPKQAECTDKEKIQAAITQIHFKLETHKGGGAIVMACTDFWLHFAAQQEQ